MLKVVAVESRAPPAAIFPAIELCGITVFFVLLLSTYEGARFPPCRGGQFCSTTLAFWGLFIPMLLAVLAHAVVNYATGKAYIEAES
jgi:hypothetical protein